MMRLDLVIKIFLVLDINIIIGISIADGFLPIHMVGDITPMMERFIRSGIKGGRNE